MTTIETAKALSLAFERRTRDNGESFTALRDGSPEWMQEAIFAAHDNGEILPNDWSYRLIERMADHIAESLEYDSDKDLGDIVAEGIDGAIPCYNGERLDWLASHLGRAAMVDEAVEEYGWPSDGGIMQAIAYGISRELDMIGAALVAAIEAEADDE